MKNLVVDTGDFKNNINIVKQKADGTPIYAVLKANGYGLGVVGAAKLLSREGISRFAVTEPKEAALLRKAGFTQQEILMLRPTTEREELEELIDQNVICTAGSHETAIALNGVAESRSTVVEAHIKIDTGMGRYGFLPGEFDKIRSVFNYMPNIAVSGMYTHFHSAFASAKETSAQLELFEDVLAKVRAAGFETGTVHAANSSALFKYPRTRLDAVRVGSAFLGRLSFKGNYGLKKLGYLETGIEELRWLPSRHPVGYGAAYRTKNPTRVAIVPVGYYHGFGAEKGRDLFRFRDAARGSLSLLKSAVTRKAYCAYVGGRRSRVLGHIGMLHTAIDVTDIPDCSVGDIVTMEINPLLSKGLDVVYR